MPKHFKTKNFEINLLSSAPQFLRVIFCLTVLKLHSFVLLLSVKGKVVPVYAMKAYVRSRSMPPIILNLSSILG